MIQSVAWSFVWGIGRRCATIGTPKQNVTNQMENMGKKMMYTTQNGYLYGSDQWTYHKENQWATVRSSIAARQYKNPNHVCTCKQTAFLTTILYSRVRFSFYVRRRPLLLGEIRSSASQFNSHQMFNVAIQKSNYCRLIKTIFFLLESLVPKQRPLNCINEIFVKRHKCDRLWHSLFLKTNHR